MSGVWVVFLVFWFPAQECGPRVAVACPAEFNSLRECEYALHLTLKKQAPKAVEDGRVVEGFCQEVYR